MALAAPDAALDCRTELTRIVVSARRGGYEAVEGPYEVAPGDLRAHAIVAEGFGHRIDEHHCENGRVVSRSWTESPPGSAEELTMESLERVAQRLYQGRRQQQQ